MSQLSLALLGPFSATVDDIPITGFRTDKTRALLAYLALEPGRPHSRHTLAGLLWPDLPERQSLDNVRVTLYRLRQTLDVAQPELSNQVFTVTRQSVQLNSAAVRIDVADFEAVLVTPTAYANTALLLTQLAETVTLYRGELLTGFSLADAPTYEEWLLLRREQLAARALLSLKTLADAYESQGDWKKAYTYATRLLELDPYGEASRRQLMRILAQRGLPDQALAQYATLRRLLRDELGVEPNAQTVALYEQIRDGKDDVTAQKRTITPPSSGQWSEDRLIVAPSSGQLAPLLPVTNQNEIPFTGSLIGRTDELACLKQWLVQDGCRLVAVLGLGGIGKTSLVANAAGGVAGHFERVLWRSLINAPPLDSLLAGLLQTLAEQPLVELPTTLDEQLALLFGYLQRQRVLLVLDNLESILDSAEAGRFRPSYEVYDQLLWRAATSEHRSALLLTSRERPSAIARLTSDTPLVRSLLLKGLDEVAGQALLAERGVVGQSAGSSALVARYSGNPLALKLVADTVHELFDSDVASFLAEETLIFDDVRKILAQQFERLTEMEQAILFWLAIEREFVDAQALRRNLVPPPGSSFLEALRGLQHRSLIERQREGIGLQNVVMEYLTERLVEAARVEIDAGQPNLLHRHALIKAQASDEVRQSQLRLILAPLAERLQSRLGKAGLEEKLRALLRGLQQTALRRLSYAGGNLLNLLLHLEVDVTSYDFSQLSVWQADLRGANLTAVNLAGADLTGTTFTEDFGRIFAVAFHPHGHCLAAGDTQGKVRIWSVPSGQSADLLTGHANAVMSIAFSPDGTLLASGSLDHTIRIWDWRKGRCLKVLAQHGSGVFAVAFSPDGVFLASGSQDYSVRLWDAQTGQQVAALTEHANSVLALAFHPGGRLVASGCIDNTIYLWDLSGLPSGDAAQTTTAPSGAPWGHPPASAVRLLDILHGHQHQVLALTFSPDGALLASGSADTTIRLWHWAERRVLATFQDHTHWVRSLVFSPDGVHLISGSADHTIRLWQMADQHAQEVLLGHTHVIRAIALHPNGALLASGGLDDTVRLWDLQRRQNDRAIRTIRGHVTAVRALTFSPDGKFLATGDGKGWVRLWPLEEMETVPPTPRTLPGRGTQVNCLTFSPDGRYLVCADDDRVVRIWDLTSLQTASVLHGHREAVHTARFAPQGDILATAGYEGAIYVWDIAIPTQRRLLRILFGHTLEINALHFTPDGRHLISGAADKTLRVWDFATGDCLQVVEEENGHCKTLALHSNSALLAAAGWAGLIRLYQISAANRLESFQTIQADVTRIFQVAFSPDGARLASCSEGGDVQLWDVQTGQKLLSLAGHTQPVWSVALHPNGTLLASGGDDETVRLWAVESVPPAGKPVAVWRIPGPYAGMNIAGVTGISEAQRSSLMALGAREENG